MSLHLQVSILRDHVLIIVHRHFLYGRGYMLILYYVKWFSGTMQHWSQPILVYFVPISPYTYFIAFLSLYQSVFVSKCIMRNRHFLRMSKWLSYHINVICGRSEIFCYFINGIISYHFGIIWLSNTNWTQNAVARHFVILTLFEDDLYRNNLIFSLSWKDLLFVLGLPLIVEIDFVLFLKCLCIKSSLYYLC